VAPTPSGSSTPRPCSALLKGTPIQLIGKR
jgi:hypothetical protein